MAVTCAPVSAASNSVELPVPQPMSAMRLHASIFGTKLRARRVASSLPGPWRSMDAKYSHISAKSKSCMDESSSLCDVRPSGCEVFVGSISVASLLLLSIRLLLVFDWDIVL